MEKILRDVVARLQARASTLYSDAQGCYSSDDADAYTDQARTLSEVAQAIGEALLAEENAREIARADKLEESLQAQNIGRIGKWKTRNGKEITAQYREIRCDSDFPVCLYTNNWYGWYRRNGEMIHGLVGNDLVEFLGWEE